MHNIAQSIYLLSDGCRSFTEHAINGLEADEKRIHQFLHGSLMLVTALSPVIGYDKCSEIAHKAYHDGSSLKEAAVALGYLSAEEFDSNIDPEKMAKPHG